MHGLGQRAVQQDCPMALLRPLGRPVVPEVWPIAESAAGSGAKAGNDASEASNSAKNGSPERIVKRYNHAQARQAASQCQDVSPPLGAGEHRGGIAVTEHGRQLHGVSMMLTGLTTAPAL